MSSEVRITWEPEAAKTILEIAKNPRKNGQPLLVGVVGIPGSGKTVSSGTLTDYLPHSIVMPMDGYHYSKAQLNAMENPQDVIYRRGAPDTFDPASLERDLKRILEGDEEKVSIPGFDHAVGDPQPDQHTFIRGQHDIVICEGIYLLHDGDGWDEIKKNLDYSIYIQADIDTCIERLKERNKVIPGYTAEEIAIRCEVVDRKNAETVRRSKGFATKLVESVSIGVEHQPGP